jgi:RNA polymerase sigma factor (sigma-70 family)
MNALVGRARAGDTEPIHQLLEACRPEVLAFVNARLPLHLRPQVAEDLVHNAFTAALARLAEFSFPDPDPLAAFRAWLQCFAEAAYRDWWKYVTALKRDYRRVLAVPGEDSAQGGFLERAATDEETPSRVLRRRERQASLEEALQQHLTPDEQAAVRLRYLERQSLATVAAVLDRSPGAVANLCLRARKKHRQALQDRESSLFGKQ